MRLVTRQRLEHWPLRVHWHVTVTYHGVERRSEERLFGDLHLALDWANEVRQTLVSLAHESSTEVTRGRDRQEGVIRRYYVSDEYGAPFAIIEVRSCLDESHL
jgi:hypothetical protein